MNTGESQLPVLVWDVDDVLNNLTEEWFYLCGRRFRDIPYESLRSNPPDEVLQITRSEYLKSLDAYRMGNQHKLKVRSEVMEFFQKYGARYQHIALTAVPRAFAGISAQWVFTALGNWIRTFHFVPSVRENCAVIGYDADKTGFLKRLQEVTLFIDDSEQNIFSARKAGFKAELFPCPWNRARDESTSTFLEKISYIGQEHGKSF